MYCITCRSDGRSSNLRARLQRGMYWGDQRKLDTLKPLMCRFVCCMSSAPVSRWILPTISNHIVAVHRSLKLLQKEILLECYDTYAFLCLFLCEDEIMNECHKRYPRCRRKYNDLALVVPFLLLFSASAWILSAPSSCHTGRVQLSRPSVLCLPKARLAAMKKDENEEVENETSNSFFSWLSSKKETKVEPKETKEEPSTGFFRSVSNKLESARESRQAIDIGPVSRKLFCKWR